MRKVPSTPKSRKRKRKNIKSHSNTIYCPSQYSSFFFLPVGENVSPTQASAAQPHKSRASSLRVMPTRVSSSRPAYVSTYRRNVSTLTYDAVPFKRTMCDIDAKTGTVSLIQSDSVHTMLIGKGWQTHIKEGKPAGAYISKGYTKFAFKVSTRWYAYFLIVHDIPIQGRFEAKDYALFQCQPSRGYTESLNKQDLINELRLLGQAQYFLDTFYARAKAFGVAKLPGM